MNGLGKRLCGYLKRGLPSYLKLEQNSCRSNPELGHPCAHAVISSDMFCAELAPHSRQYQLPRKQQTPSEPVGFLFLVRVTVKKSTPSNCCTV